MARTTDIRPCPDCRAPNPARLEHCYACGQSLLKPRDGEPLPGERTYPCLNCGAQMSFRAKNCPSCGRLAAPPESPLVEDGPTIDPLALPPLPIGWEIEALPDGTTRLTRNGWSWVSDEDRPTYLFAPLLLIGIFLAQRFSMERTMTPGTPPWTLYLLLVILGASGVFVLIWGVWGREELRVGPGFLERRRRLFGLGSARRVRDIGVLVATSSSRHSRYGTRTYRALDVTQIGKRLRLDTRSVTESWSALASHTVNTAGATDEIAALGHFLAAKTGWRFTDFDFPRR
jgi:ribosomal protein L40E